MTKNFYVYNAIRSILEAKILEAKEEESRSETSDDPVSLDPYVGPRPFTRDKLDQIRFFGREDEAEEIVSLILAHQAVLIYAQSGSGKTSLFEAKVVPELDKYDFEVLPRCRVGIPSDKVEHTDGNENQNKGEDRNLDPSSFVDKSLEEFIYAYLSAYPSTKSSNRTILLVFDQFEELFTTWPPNAEISTWLEQRQDFIRQVATVLNKFERPEVHAVFIMREEFLAELDRYVKFLPERLRPRFRLERLRKEAAIDAIAEPLKTTKGERIAKARHLTSDAIKEEINKIVRSLLLIHVEDPTPATEKKVHTLVGEFVEPIHLQVVCQQRFSTIDHAVEERRERARSEKLKWYQLKWTKNPDYEQGDDTKEVLTDEVSKDVDRALREFYEEAVAGSSADTGIDENDIRKLFDTKFISSSNTRSFVSPDDFRYVIYRMEKRHSILGRLNERLIKVYKGSIMARLVNRLQNGLNAIKKRLLVRQSVPHINAGNRHVKSGKSYTDKIYKKIRKVDKEIQGKKNGQKEIELMNALEGRHIIRGETRIGGLKWYELTHDRLIQPIKESNKEIQFLKKTRLYRNIIKSVLVSSVLIIATLVIIIPIVTRADPPNEEPTITGTGKFPIMMHYSPKDNILYTSNINDGTISFIAINKTANGIAHDVLKNITVGNTPMGIDSNPDIDRLYVANYENDQISVVNTESFLNTAKTKRIQEFQEIERINVGDKPVGVAVNPKTNAVYVTNGGSNSISVIDGKTNLIKDTITVGKVPLGLTINPKTNTIYVANYNDNTVSIIDGSINEVIATLPVGSGPIDLATDPITNRTYVANHLDNSVTIIEGTTNQSSVIDNVPSEYLNRPFDIVVSPFNDQIFISNSASEQVAVLDGETNEMLAPISTEPGSFGLAIDPDNKAVFVAHPFAKLIKKVWPVGNPQYIQLNWQPDAIESYYENNTVYVANAKNWTISAYDIGTKTIRENIDLRNLTLHPVKMAINPNGKLLYTYGSGVVAAINTTSNKIVMNTSIPSALNAGDNSSAYDRETDIVVNPNTNLIYLAQNDTDEVFVYNDTMARERDNLQANDTTQQVQPKDNQINEPKDNGWYPINVNGNPSDLAVDPKTNLTYVATVGDNGYSVISGNKSDWNPLKFAPEDIAVNPNTNKIYVAYPDFVSIIDGNTSKVINDIGLNTSLTTADIYINNNTNMVYLASPVPYEMQAIEVIDGTNNTLLGEIPLLRSANDLSFGPNGSQILMSIPELNIVSPIKESVVKPREKPFEDTLDFISEFRN